MGSTNSDGVYEYDSSDGAPTADVLNLQSSALTAKFQALDAVVPYTRQVFTSSGNWNKPAGVKAVRVTCVGGGGAGGGANTTSDGQMSCGGGGGGAAMAESVLDPSSLASSVTVTVGAGGTGVAGGTGGDGGDSSFGAHVLAKGGGGGLASAASSLAAMVRGGVNGSWVNSVGDVKTSGQYGHPATRISSIAQLGACGGASPMGGGAGNVSTNSDGTSADATGARGYGGGGGGGSNSQSQGTARAGGNGARGVVIVDCYF